MQAQLPFGEVKTHTISSRWKSCQENKAQHLQIKPDHGEYISTWGLGTR